MPRLVKLIAVVLPHLVLGVSFTSLAAQATQSAGAAGVGGLRAYWLVFIAYAIVILMVLGWVISIGRRLKDIQERLGK
ncbi:MAG: CcmD family protein [Gemmatimonadetes bacterium]|nr:CcmD family protein [Gemmatimonadota bacterium]